MPALVSNTTSANVTGKKLLINSYYQLTTNHAFGAKSTCNININIDLGIVEKVSLTFNITIS